MGATVELRLPDPLSDDLVAHACAALTTRLCAGGVSRVVCHLDRVGSDLAAVDALARLALTVQRAGVALDLRGLDPELPGLLQLVGLSGVLLDAADA